MTGAENWRFAWALMAGTSYCLTNNLKLDVGYRYSRVNGGRMFELAPVAGSRGPGFDDGFNVHEAAPACATSSVAAPDASSRSRSLRARAGLQIARTPVRNLQDRPARAGRFSFCPPALSSRPAKQDR